MDLSIGEVAKRTGVAEGTLRMWESRYGFPMPQRTESGRRRYSERDVELVRRVVADRAAGISLAVAVQRTVRDVAIPARSLYAALRRRRPELAPCTLRQGVMVALSHAIEVESLSRAEAPLLFGSFQRERFFRHEEPRWRELARGAELAVAFADFPSLHAPRGGLVEIPVSSRRPAHARVGDRLRRTAPRCLPVGLGIAAEPERRRRARLRGALERRAGGRARSGPDLRGDRGGGGAVAHRSRPCAARRDAEPDGQR